MRQVYSEQQRWNNKLRTALRHVLRARVHVSVIRGSV